ncbi:MAG: hypothetical protein HFG22_01090 [Lachnospiraceae bacterium]|nr:hypothetical protein [Lachnospiraceae bacterium]
MVVADPSELLQTLGERLSVSLKSTLKNAPDPTAPESGVFLFFSFDLAGSTSFKAEHPSLWANVFTCFYSQVLGELGVEDYKTPNNDDDDPVCVRRLWKLIGDEVLIYVQVTDREQLYTQIVNVNRTLDGLMEKIAQKADNVSSHDLCSQRHCQAVQDVILSTLGIKATAWLAECYDQADPAASNIIYHPTTTPFNERRIDFLGREIDEGFRIAKYAIKDKLILSPLLAWMIWKTAQSNKDDAKIVASNFKIISFIAMKGVWRGRKVPLVMFHQAFDRLEDILEYDELEAESFANVKEAGIRDFATDSRFSIQRIDAILGNVHKLEDAQKLYAKLKDRTDIELFSSHIERKRGFHIACLIFDEQDRILLHTDPDKGQSPGCLKRVSDADPKSWKALCEEGYKEKYDIDINTAVCPIPIATYQPQDSNALGLVIMADYPGDPAVIDLRKDWGFYTAAAIDSGTGTIAADLKVAIHRALAMRQAGLT